MESFTHEEFITAMRMQGKEVAVTPLDLSRRESQAKVSKASVSERWSKACEDEEINRERKLRDERKKVSAQLASVAAARSRVATTSDPPTVRTTADSVEREKPVVDSPQASPRHERSDSKEEDERPVEAAKEESVTAELAPTLTPLSVKAVATQIEALGALQASDTSGVQRLTVEMWWEGLVDLDLSCIALSASKELRGLFFFGEQEFGAALSHSGDMLSAPPPFGAKEAIAVDTAKIPLDVGYLYFMMTAFSADTCAEVHQLLVRVIDGDSSRVISGVNHVSMASKRAACLCRLVRAPPGFELQFVEDLTFDVGDTVRALTKDVVKHAMRAPR